MTGGPRSQLGLAVSRAHFSPLHQELSAVALVCAANDCTLTQGIHGVRVPSDSLSENLGSRLSINAFAPSAASPDVPRTLIARESRMCCSSMLS